MAANEPAPRQLVLPLKDWSSLWSYYERNQTSHNDEISGHPPVTAETLKETRITRLSKATNAAKSIVDKLLNNGDISGLLRELLVSSNTVFHAGDVKIENFVVCFSVNFDTQFLDSDQQIIYSTILEIIDKFTLCQIKQILNSGGQVDFASDLLWQKKAIKPDDRLSGEFYHNLGLVFYELFLPGSGTVPPSNSEVEGISVKETRNQEYGLEEYQDEDVPGSEEGRRRGSVSSSCKSAKTLGLSKLELEMQQNSIPVSISRLISDLIQADTSDGESTFQSLQDVNSELDQMIKEPNIFIQEYPIPTELVFNKQRIFGRETELATFLQVAANVPNDSLSNINNIMLVGGEAGIGKSHFLSTVKDLLSSSGYLCLYCKFDRLARNQPLSTLASAFEHYLGQIAALLRETEDAATQEAMRFAFDSIEAHLTAPGLVFLSGLIPSLQSLFPDVFARVVLDDDDCISVGSDVGNANQSNNEDAAEDDKEDDCLDADNSRNRLFYLFRQLILAISNPQSPIYIFVDDIDCADETSFDLLTSISTEFNHLLQEVDNEFDLNLHGLMIIGSYRTESVQENDSIVQFFRNLESADGVHFNLIVLTGMQAGTINCMISDVMKLPTRLTRELAEEIYNKTLGSPRACENFMTALVEEGLLTYSLAKKRWLWSIDSIQDASIGDDVADIITQKLERMPKAIRDAVAIASCFGQSVGEEIVNILNNNGVFGDIIHNLDQAIDVGIIQKRNGVYSFPHDVVTQAAYNLHDAEELEQCHFKIAVELLKGASTIEAPELNPITFQAVQQIINATEVQVFDPTLRRALAILFIKASERAVDLADFSAAKTFSDHAFRFVADDDWVSTFSICLRMHENALYIAYLNQPQRVNHIFDEIILHTQTLEHQVKSYYILIRALASSGKVRRSIDVGFSILERLGEKFPSDEEFTLAAAKKALVSTKDALASFSLEQIMQSRLLVENLKYWALRIMDSITGPIFISRPRYVSLILCRMVQISIEYGVSQASCHALLMYSIKSITIFGDVTEAYRIAKMSVCLAERLHATKIKPKIMIILSCFMKIWVEPIQSIASALRSYQNEALLVGDLEHSVVAGSFSSLQNMMSGNKLCSVEKEMTACCLEMLRLNQIYPLAGTASNLTAVLLLAGSKRNPFGELNLPMKSEDELLQCSLSSGRSLNAQLIYFNRMMVAFYCKEFDKVVEFAEKYESLGKNSARLQDIYHVFYQGLTAMRFSRLRGNESSWLTVGERSVAQFQEWVVNSTWNFENKLMLLEAELHFSNGEHEKAKKKYLTAIESARRHQFLNEMGLAMELFGLFCKHRGDSHASGKYIANAIDCFKNWGAFGIIDFVGKI